MILKLKVSMTGVQSATKNTTKRKTGFVVTCARLAFIGTVSIFRTRICGSITQLKRKNMRALCVSD